MALAGYAYARAIVVESDCAHPSAAGDGTDSLARLLQNSFLSPFFFFFLLDELFSSLEEFVEEELAALACDPLPF